MVWAEGVIAFTFKGPVCGAGGGTLVPQRCQSCVPLTARWGACPSGMPGEDWGQKPQQAGGVENTLVPVACLLISH